MSFVEDLSESESFASESRPRRRSSKPSPRPMLDSPSGFADSSTQFDESNSEMDVAFKSRQRMMMDDATSTNSAYSGGQGPYEVIEYDVNDGAVNGIDIMVDFEPFRIDEDSPAAAALRANANVKVSTMGKAARAVHLNAVRKIVKRASLATKNGVTRGKPPRLPPTVEGGIADYHSTPLRVIDESSEFDDSETENQKKAHAPKTSTTIPVGTGVVSGTAEAGKKVLEQVDTHDLLKLLRWRRKRKEAVSKTPKSYVRGKVIDGEHELYTLSIAVMIGVRTSITRTNTELNSGPGHRWVRPFDFRVTEKYEFRPKGGSMTPPHMLAHTFKFKDYSPVIFSYLRRMFGVNEFDFLLSVCGNANFIEFISNAKSGQFFFYSSDGKYMIKTMTNAESKFLRRILPDYFKHCAENPNTMITRFFGMYRVKLYHLRRNMKFVIMNSVYHTDKYLQTFYDLKGSVLGRDAKPGQGVKKDNDLRRALPESAISIRPQQRKALRAQLVADTDFLTQMGIMDYSMLVGIHHIPPKVDRRGSSLATLGFRPHLNNSHSELMNSSRSEFITETTSESSDNQDAQVKLPAEESGYGAEHPRMGKHDRTLSEVVGAYFIDHGLEDDDGSYLDGTEGRPSHDRALNADTEKKKQSTIEKLYWPFHRYFDIHGHRRVQAATCAICMARPCICMDGAELLNGYKVPRFAPPLSNRKDKGFEMDTTGLKLPLRFKGPQGEELYEGKIFYMGIIDILQEYSTRKLLETGYRSFQSNRMKASCVPPQDYASRFVSFFDEYTRNALEFGEKDKSELEEEQRSALFEPPGVFWVRNSK